MILNRRGFIGSILALGAAPAIVRADSLMRVVARDTSVSRLPLDLIMDFSGGEYSMAAQCGARIALIKEMVLKEAFTLKAVMFDSPEWRAGVSNETTKNYGDTLIVRGFDR